MIKRILSLTLSVILLLSLFNSVYASEKTTVYEYDTALISLADSMFDLICTDDALYIDDTKEITRGDFVYAMGTLLKWPAQTESSVPYTDIAADDVRLPAVSSALNLGYLSLADTFNPDEPIKLADAVKLAVSGAGYSRIADVKGGYPAGYMAAARDADILDNLNLESELLTGTDFKILMYNMMNCAYLFETNFGDTVGYENINGKTLLGDIHKMYVYEGLVTATPDSRLTNVGNLDDGKIEINGICYNSEINSSDLLGYNLIGLYTKSSSSYTVLSAVKSKNTVVEIAGTDLANYPPSSDRIGVYNGDKVTYYKLKSPYDFIYNGKSFPTHNNTKWGNEFIDITIVDNNDDGIFDVAFAYENLYYTIGELSDLNYEITDKMGINGVISLHDPDIKVYTTDENGESIEWYNLKESSVVAARISNDGMLVNLKSLNGNISGSIEQINSSDSTVIIGGNKYRISPYCNMIIGGIKLGVTYTFKTDGDVIVAPASYMDTEMYGYIIEAGTTSGLEAAVCVKMLKDNGKIDVLKLKNKITLNGVDNISSSSSQVSSVINIRQLVKYKVNSDGDISSIRMATSSGTSPFVNKSDEYTEFRRFNIKNDTSAVSPTPINPLYKSGTATFVPYCCVKNTTFFVVPGSSPTVDEDDIFATASYSALGFSNNDTYTNVEFYDISSSGMCRVAVYTTDTPVSHSMLDASCALIEQISTSINDEGDQTSKLYLLTENGYATYVTDKYINTSSYDKGDVIRYVTDGKGTITNMNLDFDLTNSANRYTTFNSWTTNADTAYILSRLYSYEDGYAYLSPVTTASSVPDYTWDGLKYTRFQGTIAIYNMISGESRYGTAADFKSYKQSGVASLALAKTNKYIDAEFIVIYEE